MEGLPLSWVLGAAYVLIGLGLAGWLHHHGHAIGTTASALVAWPLMAPLVRQAPPAPRGAGPLAARIDARLRALALALDEPGAEGLVSIEELDALRRSLHATDARLGAADRILGTISGEDRSEQATRLRAARAHTQGELEEVLGELEQLRLQAALLVLNGERTTARERVSELLGRARAIEEVMAPSPWPRPTSAGPAPG